MTLIAFIIAQIAAALWFRAFGRILVGPLTVYVAASLFVLMVGVFFAFRSGDKRCELAALILIGNFALSYLIWAWLPNPLLAHAVLNVATAAYFILYGETRWELLSGGCFLLLLFAAMASAFGFIPDSAGRPASFAAISYPDLNALLKYAAVILLGIGAGDVGRRVLDTGPVRAVYVGLGNRWGPGSLLRLPSRQEVDRSSEAD